MILYNKSWHPFLKDFTYNQEKKETTIAGKTDAGGANKVTEIADKAHITTATLSYVLKSLDTVGIISKITPMTEKENNRRSVCEVTDSMYRFWYSFVPGARAAIEMNRGEVYYKNYVKDLFFFWKSMVTPYFCMMFAILLLTWYSVELHV